ncbi:hypothetical protein DL96DRAFT_1596656 [Flagelloscypha sp. PMI_526]|nr:hypothetical protein DL96DRAFT_1596656 [Flagelloscypha sp. PMI_526]
MRHQASNSVRLFCFAHDQKYVATAVNVIKLSPFSLQVYRLQTSAMITRFSIVTLVIFIISIFFVIRPVSFKVSLPFRRKPVRITIDLNTAPHAAILILWASQCIAASTIRHGIVGSGEGILPYNILILFFSLAYMAITLDISGVLKAAAFWVSNRGGSSGWRLYTYFYLMVLVLSVILGNDPIILSGTVFLVYYTEAANLDPVSWLIAEFAAANTASMVLFVGNPTNVVICEGFGINQAGFTAYTILPFVACSVASFVGLAIQFRKEKYIPKILPPRDELNPRAVLRDPVAAIVGAFLLGGALIVCLVVSFFHVDVWKVTLPFAGAKFIFDLSWDHYQFIQHKKHPEEQQSDDFDEFMVAQLRQKVHGDAKTPTSPTFSPRVTDDPPPDKAQPSSGESDATEVGSEDKQPVKPTQEEPEYSFLPQQRKRLHELHKDLAHHFPVFFTALPRLPFGLVPFAFSQFILIEGLDRQGWIDVFGKWFSVATGGHIQSSVWIMGIIGVILCNCAGTNIGATILLTKVVNAAPNFPPDSRRAAGIALAIASNFGAVSFTFCASLAGLLWDAILRQKGITIGQLNFAKWNLLPLALMTVVGLGVVSAEMAVLYR